MRTYKPLSTISFNTPEFLHKALGQLEEQEIISFWMTCFHEPDTDSKKPHFHVYIEPVTQIDTSCNWFKELFIERQENDLPLNVLPWRRSAFSDWYLYAKHDRVYLKAKGFKVD